MAKLSRQKRQRRALLRPPMPVWNRTAKAIDLRLKRVPLDGALEFGGFRLHYLYPPAPAFRQFRLYRVGVGLVGVANIHGVGGIERVRRGVAGLIAAMGFTVDDCRIVDFAPLEKPAKVCRPLLPKARVMAEIFGE